MIRNLGARCFCSTALYRLPLPLLNNSYSLLFFQWYLGAVFDVQASKSSTIRSIQLLRSELSLVELDPTERRNRQMPLTNILRARQSDLMLNNLPHNAQISRNYGDNHEYVLHHNFSTPPRLNSGRFAVPYSYTIELIL